MSHVARRLTGLKKFEFDLVITKAVDSVRDVFYPSPKSTRPRQSIRLASGKIVARKELELRKQVLRKKIPSALRRTKKRSAA